tara:strand:+ start:3013 stop:4683 length:1671 start_codon:yes stop_codon:yes gene_type:complete
MAKIHTLKIKNYRCIKNFKQVFNDAAFVCLIGRGDSGKTTMLNAISAVLSPNWNYSFSDTDFYSSNVNKPITIEVTLYDLPPGLLTDSKFGLYKRIINRENQIIDDILNKESKESRDALTIRLKVNEDLEPRWYVVNKREHQEDIEIHSSDRAKLNVFVISDYLDKHFSWGKGTPLYSLLKLTEVDIETEKILSEANRKAKNSIKESGSFGSFNDIIKNIKEAATKIGLSTGELEAFIDFRNELVKEGNITLHSGDIPFRLSGKGTKRLLSIAIQLELAKHGGIILIDELEQGLEPDRAKFLAKYLKDNNGGQVFVTTHSNNVLVEMEAENIYLKSNGTKHLFSFSEDFQGCIRKNPEAFFAKKVIVCEGATEIGICRALNNFRIENDDENLALLGVALADGTGSNFVQYCKTLKQAGLDVCAFCDSDEKGINKKKSKMKEMGITIVDCDNNNSIEQQLFRDLPWGIAVKMVRYVIREKTENSVLSVTGKASLDELFDQDTIENRVLLGEKAKEYGWFKRIDHGERIGKYWFNSIEELENKTIKRQYDELSTWIDK